jgi:C-5 cytosine-specific DNA methylase
VKPLCIDLFCGLGGWTRGALAEGYECVGFDIERHEYVVAESHFGGLPKTRIKRYPAQLVLQDVLTLHGSQFRDAALIVASPPCQEYSYMAMPWKRSKQIAAALRGEGEFPEGYTGSRNLQQLNALFNACFRLQLEASQAAARHIPMVVENVKGAQPWVGRAKAHYGSYYLWGDVESVGDRITIASRMLVPLLKAPRRTGGKVNPDGTAHPQGSWFAVADSQNRGAHEGRKVDGLNFHEHEKTGRPGRSFQSAAVEHTKNGSGGSWFPISHGVDNGETYGTNPVRGERVGEGIKQHGSGAAWFDKALDERRKAAGKGFVNGLSAGTYAEQKALGVNARNHNSKSSARKSASAMIAEIPFELAACVARAHHPALEKRA